MIRNRKRNQAKLTLRNKENIHKQLIKTTTMKKILLFLALTLPVLAVAQPKNSEEAKNAIEKALSDSKNEKKALKASTWVSLSDAYLNAYDVPTLNLLPNTPQTEVKLFLKGQQVISNETRKGTEGEYSVDVYADKDLYYNHDGILEFWVITKPVVENALQSSMDALLKANALETKDAKKKEYVVKAETIHQKFYNEALSCYLMGDTKDASYLFEETAKSANNKILNKVDSSSLYYTALMAGISGEKERAIEFYKKCIGIGFTSQGSVYSNLAEEYKQMGDTLSCKETLEKGFAENPESQGILVGLINYYITSGDEPVKLFDLLHAAQENEPTNASLYYVEGDVYKKLGNTEKAIEFFKKSTEIDPSYVFGTLNIGILYYEQAVDLQSAASEELDDTKYNKLMEQFEASLEKAIEPFEEAFNMTNDNELKIAVAEYLKNIYFRFRSKGPDYQASYEKYNKFITGE